MVLGPPKNLAQFSTTISEIMRGLFHPVKLVKLAMRQKFISTESYAKLKTCSDLGTLPTPPPFYWG